MLHSTSAAGTRARRASAALPLVLRAATASARAEVVVKGPTGFVVQQRVDVPQPAQDAYDAFTRAPLGLSGRTTGRPVARRSSHLMNATISAWSTRTVEWARRRAVRIWPPWATGSRRARRAPSAASPPGSRSTPRPHRPSHTLHQSSAGRLARRQMATPSLYTARTRWNGMRTTASSSASWTANVPGCSASMLIATNGTTRSRLSCASCFGGCAGRSS